MAATKKLLISPYVSRMQGTKSSLRGATLIHRPFARTASLGPLRADRDL